MQRHPLGKDRIQTAHGDLGGLQTVVEGHDEGKADRPGPHAAAAADCIVHERQKDKRHAQGVQEHQNRNGRDNDGLKTEQTDQVGDDRKDRYPSAVLDAAAGQTREVRGRAADETDGCRKA